MTRAEATTRITLALYRGTRTGRELRVVADGLLEPLEVEGETLVPVYSVSLWNLWHGEAVPEWPAARSPPGWELAGIVFWHPQLEVREEAPLTLTPSGGATGR